MKLYVAGPMSGTPGFNYAAFDEAAATLRGLGFEVVSPAEMDKARNPVAYEIASKSPDGKLEPSTTGGLTWAQILSNDIIEVADKTDGLALLPGWAKSSGARLEVFVGLLRKKLFGIYSPDAEAIQFVEASMIRQILKKNLP